MGNSLTKLEVDTASSKLKDMIGSEEKVQQISRKTTVKTNEGEHTVWEIGKKNGDVVMFSHSKKKK